MQYRETIGLKDGRTCLLRNGTEQDAAAALENFLLAHAQTDYLRSYPEESQHTVEQERRFLREKTDSGCEIEILAEVQGRIVGTAGIAQVGTGAKVRHRAEFGVSVEEGFWGLGIGRALTKACIQCAKQAGYAQLELDVVAENHRAVRLYESLGFVEYGRNPKGFRSRVSGWQALCLMRLDLDEAMKGKERMKVWRETGQRR